MRRGKFFAGPNNILIYMTRPGHFYVLEGPGPRALSDAEADQLVQVELLVEQSYEVHALAVAAERHAMRREPHPDVEPADRQRD